MQVDLESLRQKYSEMETDQLVKLSIEEGLTDEAVTILNEILSTRGITKTEKDDIVEQILNESDDLGFLAPISNRIKAQILDVIIAVVILNITFVFFRNIISYNYSILYILPFFSYLLFRDAFPNGQSLGKRIMKIAVVNKFTGKDCSILESMIRNLLLYLLGIIDLFFMKSKLQQRLGDLAADTIVISINHKDDILMQVERINKDT